MSKKQSKILSLLMLFSCINVGRINVVFASEVSGGGVFISEYIEGGNNKAVEVFNAT